MGEEESGDEERRARVEESIWDLKGLMRAMSWVLAVVLDFECLDLLESEVSEDARGG